jgi:hypothetical protein
MTNEKIREAIEIIRKGRYEVTQYQEKVDEYNKAIETLLDLAEKYIILVEAIKTHLLGEGQCGSITKTE